MTLGSKNFRLVSPPYCNDKCGFKILPFSACGTHDMPMYLHHHSLHKRGFLFCCSAGNAEFSGFATQSKGSDHPTSFFANYRQCVVIGSHAINGLKQPCLPLTFGSAACCASDQEGTDKQLNQGVTTWAVGENIVIPKINQQKNDQIVGGTSVSSAIIAGMATLILPRRNFDGSLEEEQILLLFEVQDFSARKF